MSLYRAVLAASRSAAGAVAASAASAVAPGLSVRSMTQAVRLNPKNPRAKPPSQKPPVTYPYDAAKSGVVPTTDVGYTYSNSKLVTAPKNMKQEILQTTNRGDPRFTFVFPEEAPYVLTASIRESGRDSSFECRQTGFVPCVIHSTSTTRNLMLIAIEAMELERLGRRKDAHSLLVNIVINGYEEPITCMVKQWIIEGSTQKTNTVSFATYEPQFRYKISTPVTLVNTNDCAGLKRNSSLFQPMPCMKVTFLPSVARLHGLNAPPSEFKLDVVDLVPEKIGGSIKSSDIPLPPFLELEKGSEDHCLFTFHIGKRMN